MGLLNHVDQQRLSMTQKGHFKGTYAFGEFEYDDEDSYEDLGRRSTTGGGKLEGLTRAFGFAADGGAGAGCFLSLAVLKLMYEADLGPGGGR